MSKHPLTITLVAMGDRVKRKKHSYYGKCNAKKSKFQFVLEPGLKGFICTCNNRERDCVREAYNILNEYADELYGEEKPTPKADQNDPENGESEDEDIQSALAREVDSLKAEKSKSASCRRFQIVESGAANCLFIRTTLEDPVSLVQKILLDVEATQKQKTRFLLRMIPVEATCKAWPDDIEAAVVPLLDKYFKGEPKSFTVIFNRRNNNNVLREELIQLLAEKVKLRNPLHRVDMKTAELSIIVEVIRNMCCMSVVPQYHHYRKYNLIELAKPRSDSESTGHKASNQGQESNMPKTDGDSASIKDGNEKPVEEQLDKISPLCINTEESNTKAEEVDVNTLEAVSQEELST